jgi:hypothetical protein
LLERAGRTEPKALLNNKLAVALPWVNQIFGPTDSRQPLFVAESRRAPSLLLRCKEG